MVSYLYKVKLRFMSQSAAFLGRTSIQLQKSSLLIGKLVGCNWWKSGNSYGFRSKSSFRINLDKLYEISATCDKLLIDSDGSSEITILSLKMAYFRFWLSSLFFRITLWTETFLSYFLIINVIVDPFGAYLQLYFVLQTLWKCTGLPKMAYFLKNEFFFSSCLSHFRFCFQNKPNKNTKKLNTYESK